MNFDSSNFQTYTNVYRFLALKRKNLGSILQEAGLISQFQLQSALENQIYHPDLRIGEILAEQNLIKPETADFFVQDWLKAIAQPEKNTLGYYLREAAILNSAQVEIILAQQRVSGIRFGTVAVFQGFLRSTTLDFFLENLYPEQLHVSPFVNMNSRSNY